MDDNISRKAAIEAVRDAILAHEWPPQDGDKQIDEVLEALNALPAVGGWLDIESAPRNVHEILVGWFEDGKWCYRLSSYEDTESRRGFSHRNGACDATHWMPLPAPPEIE